MVDVKLEQPAAAVAASPAKQRQQQQQPQAAGPSGSGMAPKSFYGGGAGAGAAGWKTVGPAAAPSAAAAAAAVAPAPPRRPPAADQQLWVEKWRPKSSQELVGNQITVTTLRQWLGDWERVHLHGGEPRAPPGRCEGAGAGCGPAAFTDVSSGRLRSSRLSPSHTRWPAPWLGVCGAGAGAASSSRLT